MSVVRELYRGNWHNTYFADIKKAKKLCRKILKKGGIAICLKCAY